MKVMRAISSCLPALALAMVAMVAMVAMTAFSCHVVTPPAPSNKQGTGYWLSRVVVQKNGKPSVMTVVLLTDLTTHEMVAITKTDHNGRFRVAIPQKSVALTATAEREVAYVPHVDGDSEGSPIQLGTDCFELQGRVELIGYPRTDVFVRFSRISKELGDSFGAILGPDGRYHVCLPSAFYEIKLPESLAPRQNFQFVPRSEPLSFRTAKPAEIERALESREGLSPDSAASFVAGLPVGVKVLGIAETNHGSREFSDERTRLAIELARKKDFSLVMIEAGYGEALPLDEYIGGANVDIVRAVERLGYWVWDTKTFLDALEQLKAYNAQLPSARRIHIVGFDVQTTAGAVDYLSRNASLSPEEVGHIAPLGERDGKGWKDLPSSEQSTVRSILERVAADQDAASAFSRKNQAMLAARSLLQRIEHLEAKNPWYKDLSRDAGMARMIVEVLALEPRARASLWAHLGHLSREYIVGTATAGHRLAAKLGSSYQVYALLAYSGSVRAWDPKGKIGVIPHQIPPPPADSVEAGLFRYRRGGAVTYWPFARARGEAATWLHGLHRLMEFGAVYPGDQKVVGLWDLQGIDGAVLFDRVTPSIPTATGERVATPASP
jgi:erythromycin esterase